MKHIRNEIRRILEKEILNNGLSETLQNYLGIYSEAIFRDLGKESGDGRFLVFCSRFSTENIDICNLIITSQELYENLNKFPEFVAENCEIKKRKKLE